MKKIIAFVIVGFIFSFVSQGLAETDSASVSEALIPWSGPWWPATAGRLVVGYNGHPSPLEKYDAYTSGYYPGEVTAYGLENEYNPDAYPWVGHCDNWAAASIMYPEPDTAGDLNGILFNVGDKKGILTLSLKERVSAVFFGTRFNSAADDYNDIYPGGADGFHETLINYIKIQGKPIIMDLDPNAQVWNYPAYRYEMDWYDEPGRRHVTCQVWFASDDVQPDFTGIASFSQTFRYWLAIDGSGNLIDEPGEWESSNHPDFLWYPTGLQPEWLMSDAAVDAILQADTMGSDDAFEENDQASEAATITVLQKNRFYPASGFDEDWYQVWLEKGEDLVAFAVTNLNTPLDNLDVSIHDPMGNPVGFSVYHGTLLGEALETGMYKISVSGIEEESFPYYNIEFFSSASVMVPHVDVGADWNMDMVALQHDLLGAGEELRIKLLDGDGLVKAISETSLYPGEQARFSLSEELNITSPERGWAKLLHINSSDSPDGVYSYFRGADKVSLPFSTNSSNNLYIPTVENSGNAWTGIALMNMSNTDTANVEMAAYGTNGDLIGTKIFDIAAKKNKVGMIDGLWGGAFPEQAAWVHLKSSQPLQGISLWGDKKVWDNPEVDGLNLTQVIPGGNVLYVPHLDYNGGWTTEIYLVNPGEDIAALNCVGYTKDGVIAGEASVQLPAKGAWHGPSDMLIPGIGKNIGWIEIQSDTEVGGFARFFKNGQRAAVPLPSENQLTTSFAMPYVPGSEDGWTGLVLLNPHTKKSDIYADPYDAKGNRLMPDGTHLWYNVPNGVPAKRNAVGFVEKLFTGLPETTAYLLIHSDEPITGFGLHGDMQSEILETMYMSPLSE